MIRLVVSPGRTFDIYGQVKKEGEEFFCTEKEAVLWRKLGWAHDPVPPSSPRQSYQTRDQKADEPETPSKQNQRGRYRRSDMRAED